MSEPRKQREALIDETLSETFPSSDPPSWPSSTASPVTTGPAAERRPSARESASALVLRLALGVAIFPHGAQKVFGVFGGAGFSGTLAHFEEAWGVPAVLTVLVMAAELLGSIGLVLGVLTRLAALGIAAVMAGAVVLVHQDQGFFMNWSGQQQGEGFEYHLLAIGIALALVVTGGGRWAVDRVLWTRGSS